MSTCGQKVENKTMNPDLDNFFPGAVISPVDHRDYLFDEVRAVYPAYDWTEEFDIEKKIGSLVGDPNFKIQPKNQNGSGSCGGQAWSYYASVLKTLSENKYAERSAKFIYSQTFVPPGGSNGRDNCKILQKQGDALESLCSSYDGGQAPQESFMERYADVTVEAQESAALDRIGAYFTVKNDIESVAAAIIAGNGCILMVVGQNNGTWQGNNPQAPNEEKGTWLHWLYAGKIRSQNGKKQIGFINSWGNSVGDNGWQWIDESYFKPAFIPEAWVFVYDNTPPISKITNQWDTDMHFGDQSNDVQKMQLALKIDGEFPSSVSATGFYGPITQRAVLSFQKKYNVAPSSVLENLAGKVAGPGTRAQFNRIFGE